MLSEVRALKMENIKVEMADINANFKSCSTDMDSDSGAEMGEKEDSIFGDDLSLDVKKSGKKGKHTPQVTRRNERERNRVKHINKTFHILRQHLPTKKPNRKMSKVETLRMAVEYIRCMKDMIVEHDQSSTPYDNQPYPGFTVHPGLTTNNRLLPGNNGLNLSNNGLNFSNNGLNLSTNGMLNPNNINLSNNGFLAANAGLLQSANAGLLQSANANFFQANPGLFMYAGLCQQQGLRNAPSSSSPVSGVSSPSPTYSSDSSYEGLNSENLNRVSRNHVANHMDISAELW